MRVGDLNTNVTEEGTLRVVYELWDTDPDKTVWCTRCIVWLALADDGTMFRMKATPMTIPKEMLDQLKEHNDKLKTILLLSRK